MNRGLFVAFLAVVGFGLAWGFSIVGSPGFARMEANDKIRATNLRRLGLYYACVNDQRAEADTAVSPTYCGRGGGELPDVQDPTTGAPYRYTREDTQFRICATFEVPAGQRRGPRNRIVFDGQEGCVRYTRASPTGKWYLAPIE